MICRSNPPKKNSLFLIHGPPIVNPPDSSLARGIDFRGLPAASVANRFWKLVMEFSTVLFRCSYTLPCQALEPDLVITFTTEPALRPYSGPNWLVMRTYCCTNSVSDTNSPGPPTLLSLLF